jgi:hypothetical protein
MAEIKFSAREYWSDGELEKNDVLSSELDVTNNMLIRS